MQRLVPVIVLSLLLALSGWAPGPAAEAQTQATVALTLLSKSVWNAPDRPLKLSFRADNLSGHPLDALEVGLRIHPPVRSRAEYQLSLEEEASSPLFADTFVQEGTLSAGEEGEFDVLQELDALPALGESGIYPVGVDLRSRHEVVGTLRAPMVFLTEPPKSPLSLAWTWVLSEPVQFTPDGTFLWGPLQTDIAPGGRLDTIVRALERLRKKGLAADVAVSPVLAEQLVRMAGGYRIMDPNGTTREIPRRTGGAENASELLASLKRAVGRPGAELVALPYADASLPVLRQARLGKGYGALVERGRDKIASVLGEEPSRRVFRPPFSQVDAATVARLEAQGMDTLLLDAAAVAGGDDPERSLPPVVGLAAGGSSSSGGTSPGATSVTAVLPDPGVGAAAATTPADPRLAAHAALGQLAALYFEEGTGKQRGAAVLFPEDPEASPEFFAAFSTLVSAAPWLRPVRASDLVTMSGEAQPVALADRRYPSFGAAYAERLSRTTRRLGQFAAAVRGAEPLLEDLRARLMLARGTSFVSNPSLGTRFVNSVRRKVRETLGKIHPPDPAIPVTLTSTSRFIPIRLTNDSGYPVRVRLRLAADRRLVFTDGDRRWVELPAGTETVLVPVRAQSTGRFPVKVILETPGGSTIAETRIVVRSTAWNRTALFLTLGAAGFLMLVWARRSLSRRSP